MCTIIKTDVFSKLKIGLSNQSLIIDIKNETGHTKQLPEKNTQEKVMTKYVKEGYYVYFSSQQVLHLLRVKERDYGAVLLMGHPETYATEVTTKIFFVVVCFLSIVRVK